MITYTNVHNMPGPLARAVELDEKHTIGDISATQLIQPPRIRQLLERHDVEVDVSERLWALFGKAVHKVLEDHVQFREVQLLATVDDMALSGTVDQIERKEDGGFLIRDWKVPSAWVVVFGTDAGRLEWERQLNVYAWLLENFLFCDSEHPLDGKPIEVTELRACMIFRDWTEKKVGTRNYPDQPWRDAEVDLWPAEHRELYVKARIEMHKAAAELPDEELPLCDPEDRWTNDRTGEDVRCMRFCDARSVCSYALSFQAAAGGQ